MIIFTGGKVTFNIRNYTKIKISSAASIVHTIKHASNKVTLILDFFHSPWFRYHLAVIGGADNPSEAIPRP